MRRLEMMPFGVFRLSTAMAAGREFELLLILALVSGCIGADPCKDYDRMWMEYGRRSSDFNSEDTATSICDAFLDKDAWYRIEHDAGNRLIEKPVEPWYCGTQFPIWLNGTHPTDTTEVTAEVCATYSSIDVCGWKGTVRIQLCNASGSEYFVYQLAVPFGCPMAYCVDAASRKQCIPPLMWLHDEFKCGEQIKTSTAAPTRTSTSRSPTETPCSGPGFGPWGPWSECSKTCDHGLQTRKRTCCQPPCTGAAISHRPCAPSNCEELQEEKDKGIVLSLQSATQDTMFKVVENQKKIDTILRGNINSICSQNASLCCGVKTESTSADSNEFVISDGIYAAKGFPKQKSDGTVDHKTIAIVNEAVNQATCSSDSKRLRSRQVPSTNPNFVPFEVMEMAAKSSSSYILQETGLVVKEYLDPVTYPDDSQDDSPCPVATCIVPIVVCCAVIPAIAIIVGCITLQMMKRSAPKSTYGKDPNMVAPNMVRPCVNAGETKSGSLPGKPS